MTAALRLVRSAPATTAYIAILSATTAVLSTLDRSAAHRLLLEVSTNLHQLAHVPVRVLVGSAFWLGGWWQLALWAGLFAAVILPVERRLGWRRTTLAFAAGHVGATLLVAAGLVVGLRLDVVDPRVVRAEDVGASYGFFAVAALGTYLLGPRARLPYLGLLGGYALLQAARSATFTDVGHLLAVAIGLACYPLARPSRAASARRRARRG
jgi:hypothetical protein